MASALHRTSKQLKLSVNTPNFNPSVWIINPDLSGVDGVPVKYWKITGDVVSEMSPAEKAAYDAANPPMANPPSSVLLKYESGQELATASVNPVDLSGGGLVSPSNATFLLLAEGHMYAASAALYLEIRVNGDVVSTPRLVWPQGYMPYSIIHILELLVGDVVTLTIRRFYSAGNTTVKHSFITLKQI